MTQSNFQTTYELITKYYNFFNNKDYQGMLSLLSQDVVHDINQGERENGKESFKKFLGVMEVHYDETLKEIEISVSASGTRAAAEFICQGMYKKTADGLPPAKNQKYSLPVGTFFEVKDEQITRVTNYYNLNDWIAQVSH